MESISEPFDDLRVEPREFIEAGDEIVVIFRARGRGKGSGIPLDVELAHVFTFREGNVQVMRAHTSKASALEAVGLSA
jgi:ketosteroid isomerase-like protein